MSSAIQLQLEPGDGVTIRPRMYGHFAEHLGRCCYDGIWVGRNSAIPNQDGFRTDIIEAFKAMGVPLLRWPGGCYADHYHWRDGIGDPAKRPRRLGLSCGLSVYDDNGLGTHEFLRFCELIGAEPYLAGNMGSGSVQELCDWVEYCNASVLTDLVHLRQSNGRKPPFNVRLWGVGNENWGCGGCYDPETYGLEYRRYASMIKHVDPNAELVICGHDHEWNQRLMPVMKRHAGLIDHFSIHRYWIASGPGTAFTEEDYYQSLNEAEETETFILDTRKLLDEIDPNRRIGIALDEWGVWHPEARSWGPGGQGDCSNEYLQPATQRDAILAGVALELFHRQADSLSLANLAQIVNVLHAPVQTSGDKMWLTPTYHLLRLHKRHFGQERAPLTLSGVPELPNGKAAVTGIATTGSNGKQATILNRSYGKSYELSLPEWAKSVELLAAPSPNSENSAENPSHVSPTAVSGPTVTLPPCSALAISD